MAAERRRPRAPASDEDLPAARVNEDLLGGRLARDRPRAPLTDEDEARG